jgi:hypothetical protein
MDKKIKSVLKEAILKSLPTLHELVEISTDSYLVWIKQNEDSWRGEYQQKPSPYGAFSSAENQLNNNGACFTNLLFEHYPKYKNLVGPGFGIIENIFQSVLIYIWTTYETFDCNESKVESIVDEVEKFIDRETVRFRFQAQLINFGMTGSTLTLSEKLKIRRLNEKEVSFFHGGSSTIPKINLSQNHRIKEFIIEGEHEMPIIFGNYSDVISDPLESQKIIDMLDRAILCLRTFKGGPVGYDYIHCRPLNFFPFSLPSWGRSDLYVPFGTYRLSNDETTQLKNYAKHALRSSESSMEMALSRLADAEIRTKPQDKIVDAVIGMEALLLAAVDSKTELKYRFSIHFSTLFNSPQDRYKAFCIAKDLYDLRSSIAHGSNLTKDRTFKIGEEKHLNLVEASKRATESLRMVIQYFLPKIGSDTYKNPKFWERAYFNLENISSNF